MKYLPTLQERIGISNHRYNKWRNGKRRTLGVDEKLVKSNVDIDKSYDNKPFMQSINRSRKCTLENKPSGCGNKLTTYTTINQHWNRINKSRWYANNIWRNRHKTWAYKQTFTRHVTIYRDVDLFEPHLGNSSTVPKLEKEIEIFTNRLEKLKNTAKIAETTLKLNKIQDIYNLENRRWTDKQYCLRKQSQATRNRAILETINGNDTAPGWLGYEFYQSMYLDYRGRIYNRDPYFSYQSNDLARGHFLFAEEKPVDQKGAEYTFIHAATSFNQTYKINELEHQDWITLDYKTALKTDDLVDISVDKMGVTDKHNWTVDHIEQILDVAENPITTQNYWLSAEKPWVFLSLCFEIGGIVGSALTDETYYSSMPISIDGVNNGTQHLAAMSRDEKAGKLVGLLPMQMPKDFLFSNG